MHLCYRGNEAVPSISAIGDKRLSHTSLLSGKRGCPIAGTVHSEHIVLSPFIKEEIVSPQQGRGGFPISGLEKRGCPVSDY